MTPQQAFREYCRCLKALARLELQGIPDGPDHEAVCEAMDRPWWEMDERRRALARRASSRLNAWLARRDMLPEHRRPSA